MEEVKNYYVDISNVKDELGNSISVEEAQKITQELDKILKSNQIFVFFKRYWEYSQSPEEIRAERDQRDLLHMTKDSIRFVFMNGVSPFAEQSIGIQDTNDPIDHIRDAHCGDNRRNEPCQKLSNGDKEPFSPFRWARAIFGKIFPTCRK